MQIFDDPRVLEGSTKIVQPVSDKNRSNTALELDLIPLGTVVAITNTNIFGRGAP